MPGIKPAASRDRSPSEPKPSLTTKTADSGDSVAVFDQQQMTYNNGSVQTATEAEVTPSSPPSSSADAQSADLSASSRGCGRIGNGNWVPCISCNEELQEKRGERDEIDFEGIRPHECPRRPTAPGDDQHQHQHEHQQQHQPQVQSSTSLEGQRSVGPGANLGRASAQAQTQMAYNYLPPPHSTLPYRPPDPYVSPIPHGHAGWVPPASFPDPGVWYQIPAMHPGYPAGQPVYPAAPMPQGQPAVYPTAPMPPGQSAWGLNGAAPVRSVPSTQPMFSGAVHPPGQAPPYVQRVPPAHAPFPSWQPGRHIAYVPVQNFPRRQNHHQYGHPRANSSSNGSMRNNSERGESTRPAKKSRKTGPLPRDANKENASRRVWERDAKLRYQWQ
jgi:hypothetical protein